MKTLFLLAVLFCSALAVDNMITYATDFHTAVTTANVLAGTNFVCDTVGVVTNVLAAATGPCTVALGFEPCSTCITTLGLTYCLYVNRGTEVAAVNFPGVVGAVGSLCIKTNSTVIEDCLNVDGYANFEASIVGQCPSAIPKCSHTTSFWATHNSGGTTTLTLIAWPLLENTTICGKTYLAWLQTESVPTASFTTLVQEYIASLLNIANGAQVTSGLLDALDEARSFILARCAAVLNAEEKQEAADIKTTLRQYNEGEVGPGLCEDDSVAGSSVVTLEQIDEAVDRSNTAIIVASVLGGVAIVLGATLLVIMLLRTRGAGGPIGRRKPGAYNSLSPNRV